MQNPPRSTTKKPIWFILLNLLFLVPILAWPLVFYASLFTFDNPNANGNLQMLIFVAVNAYPLYLIALMLLNFRVYRNNKRLTTILPIVFIVLTIALAAWLLAYP